MEAVKTYSETRAHFASIWDRVIDHRESIRVQRRGKEDIVILPAAELESLQETAYLLRSPKNAQRLLQALMSSFEQQGDQVELKELHKHLDGYPE